MSADDCTQKPAQKRPVWKENSSKDFFDELDVNELLSIENDMLAIDQSDVIHADQVKLACDKFIKVLTNCVKIGSIRNHKVIRSVPRKQLLQPWYNDECERKRVEFHRPKNCVNRKDPTCSVEDKSRVSKEYRGILNKRYRNYYRGFNKKLKSSSKATIPKSIGVSQTVMVVQKQKLYRSLTWRYV